MKILPRKTFAGLGRSALVVEADTGTREICRAALECLGFSVNAVDTGVAAVAAARDAKPDIVLFDVQLRDVRGRELLHWLRSNPALLDVPMIAISVLSDDEEMRVEDRVDGILKKPITRAALKSTVRDALGMGSAPA